ncbi:MAG: LysR family transcriptional regulator [Chloroflexota bacterium]|nr:LysR family transcriptional regulator [Chloroflexota bacterium]
MQADHWQDLEIRHLVALQAIVEEGSFWAAAERLQCSTSALSQQISTLEAVVGHRVLERSRGRRRVTLTEPGRLLLGHADAIVARLRAAHADLVAFAEGGVGELRIGTYQSVGAKLLPQLLRRFAAEWPKIELRVVEGADDDELLRTVERGEIDLTFSVLPLPEGPFEGVELMRDPYVLSVPADSPLARRRTAGISTLDGLKLVGFRRSRTVAQVEEHVRTHGIEPNIVFRSDDNGIVQGMVAAGVGCALVPRLAVDLDDPSIEVVELPELPPRVLAIAWHRDRYRTPAMRAFVERALEVGKELAAKPRT